MKRIVFTELLNMVDDVFGPAVTETIISAADLPSGGADISVGTYEHSEIVALVSNLSKTTGIAVSDLINTFGQHMLGRFSVMQFLEQVGGHIHGEVLKLYPDAKLPKIGTDRTASGDLIMVYRSDRMIGDLAEGLIAGVIDYFGGRQTLAAAKTSNRKEVVNAYASQ